MPVFTGESGYWDLIAIVCVAWKPQHTLSWYDNVISLMSENLTPWLQWAAEGKANSFSESSFDAIGF